MTNVSTKRELCSAIDTVISEISDYLDTHGQVGSGDLRYQPWAGIAATTITDAIRLDFIARMNTKIAEYTAAILEM